MATSKKAIWEWKIVRRALLDALLKSVVERASERRLLRN